MGEWPHSLRVGVFHPGTQRIQEVSLAFQRGQMLEWCATGVYYKPSRGCYRWVSHLPRRIQRPILRELHKRRLDELEDDRVLTHGVGEWIHLLMMRSPLVSRYAHFIERWRTMEFGRWLASSALLSTVDVVYGFNEMSLEAFRHAKAIGKLCVLDQTSAFSGYNECVLREELQHERSFGKEVLRHRIRHLQWAATREREELRIADLVVTGSKFSMQTLAETGVNMAKVKVVGNVSTAPRRVLVPRRTNTRVRLLYVGTVTPSKGIRYLLDAMRMLTDLSIELTMIGALDMPLTDLKPYDGLFTYRPRVPRSELWEMYATADLFVFPSLSEGFARVLLEAASMGLPLVATTSSGADLIIGQNECGLLVPPRNAVALAEAIRKICIDRRLREQMSRRAWERSREFDFDNYTKRLLSAVASLSPLSSYAPCDEKRSMRVPGRLP